MVIPPVHRIIMRIKWINTYKASQRLSWHIISSELRLLYHHHHYCPTWKGQQALTPSQFGQLLSNYLIFSMVKRDSSTLWDLGSQWSCPETENPSNHKPKSGFGEKALGRYSWAWLMSTRAGHCLSASPFPSGLCSWFYTTPDGTLHIKVITDLHSHQDHFQHTVLMCLEKVKGHLLMGLLRICLYPHFQKAVDPHEHFLGLFIHSSNVCWHLHVLVMVPGTWDASGNKIAKNLFLWWERQTETNIGNRTNKYILL